MQTLVLPKQNIYILHGAGVQQQAAKTLCRAPRSFHLKIQKVIINLATDDRGTVKTFVRDLIV